jgi:hypothetical protein
MPRRHYGQRESPPSVPRPGAIFAPWGPSEPHWKGLRLSIAREMSVSEAHAVRKVARPNCAAAAVLILLRQKEFTGTNIEAV